jgi:hypothetical protein
MVSTKLAIAYMSALACAGLCPAQDAAPRESGIAGPTAVASNAEASYCFDRVRGNNPERLPPAYLVLKLHVKVSYHNGGTRPLILPLQRERTIYTGLTPGEMKVFKPRFSLLQPAFKEMKRLPADVSPDSPVDPKNDVFTVIPAGGEMTPPLSEEVTLPVTRKSPFKESPDLRGDRVYVKLRFVQLRMSTALETDLADRWARFGVPWTGTLTTNLIAVDVPARPKDPGPCKDDLTPAHKVVGLGDQK